MKTPFIVVCLFIGFVAHSQNSGLNEKLLGKWKRSDGIMNMTFSTEEVFIEQFNNGSVYSDMTGKWTVEKKDIVFISFNEKERMRFKIISLDGENLTMCAPKGKTTIYIYTKENK